MREFDELGFSERDIKFLEAHGLDTDRHMTTNEEVQKLFNAVLDMTKDELDRIPELLEEADEQTRFDIVHEAVSEVRILADRNPRKEHVVQSVTFKCPVRFFWEEVPGEADGYTAVTPDSFDADGNFRDDETHVESMAVLRRV